MGELVTPVTAALLEGHSQGSDYVAAHVHTADVQVPARIGASCGEGAE